MNGVVLSLNVDVDKRAVSHIRDKLGRFITNLPRSAAKDSYDIARTTGRTLEFSALSAGIKGWTGDLFESLRNPVRRKSGGNTNQYSIYIPIYGLYLNKMRDHYVPRKSEMPYLNLWMWADDKLGGMPQYLKVHGHPWIDEGLGKARVKIRERFANGETVRTTKKLTGR